MTKVPLTISKDPDLHAGRVAARAELERQLKEGSLRFDVTGLYLDLKALVRVVLDAAARERGEVESRRGAARVESRAAEDH